MTNKEILNANLLDIIFDNRNKEYGAYALRRDYNKRMMISLGAGLSVILFFILFNSVNPKDETAAVGLPAKKDKVVTVVIIPDEKKVEPLKQTTVPKPVQPKVEKVATAQFTNLKIVPNEQVLKPVVTQSELDGKQIDTKEAAGTEATGKVTLNDKPVDNSGTGNGPVSTEPAFAPTYSDPQYPGGQEALSRFLSQNLSTPNDLETGEKKMVRVRFKVDRDGAVTGFEIDQTGGAVYDKEVIRVCKKMRRWKPALQNGVAVPVSYVLPVTFIGIEQ